MADNIYVFEDLRALGTTVVFDDGTGNDWVFLTGLYPAVPGHSGPSTTMQLSDPIFGIVTRVSVYDSPTTFYAITFTGGIENIRGSAGSDFIDGNGAANTLMGDPTDAAGGFDWIRGLGGNDILLGIGAGDVLWGGDGDDLMFGDNDPFAQDRGNFNSGDDTLRGDGGNDTLFGGDGANTLDGGTGLDTADYSGFFDDFGLAGFAMTGSLGTGVATVTRTDFFDGMTYIAAIDTLINIEYLIGTSGDDALYGFDDVTLPTSTFGRLMGGAGNDVLTGGRFLDELYGGAGDDILLDGGLTAPPGGGNDALLGGTGQDRYWVTDARTVVFELAGGGTDLVISSLSHTLGTNVENLTLLNGFAAAVFGTGNAAANLIFGNDQANQLSGLNGSDALLGLIGADTLRGGADSDGLYGGTGNDRLYGGTEDDTLLGGDMNDLLQGGTGRDRLTGGAGRDVFVFASAAEAGNGITRDTVTDFTSGTDRIDLSKLAAGQTFIDQAAFSRVAGEIRYDEKRGILMGDLDGDRIADWQIYLAGGPLPPTATDLTL